MDTHLPCQRFDLGRANIRRVRHDHVERSPSPPKNRHWRRTSTRSRQAKRRLHFVFAVRNAPADDVGPDRRLPPAAPRAAPAGSRPSRCRCRRCAATSRGSIDRTKSSAASTTVSVSGRGTRVVRSESEAQTPEFLLADDACDRLAREAALGERGEARASFGYSRRCATDDQRGQVRDRALRRPSTRASSSGYQYLRP